MPPRPSRLAANSLSALVLLSAASCKSWTEPPTTEPWRITRAGNFGVGAALAVVSGYEVDSVIAVRDANFGDPASISGKMLGTFGAALSAEYFIVDDLALFAGGEARIFEPDLGEDLISFGEIEQMEWFVGTRWFLPTRWLATQRLRPFLHMKLAYIPSVNFDMTTTLPFPEPLNDAVLSSPYRGSSYWTLGAGGGLAYQLSENLYARIAVFYEWALNESESSGVPSSLGESTGNAFVDNIMNSLEYDISLEPRGWIAFFAISYVF